MSGKSSSGSERQESQVQKVKFRYICSCPLTASQKLTNERLNEFDTEQGIARDERAENGRHRGMDVFIT